MKRQQLQELVRLITKQILREYIGSSQLSSVSTITPTDGSVSPSAGQTGATQPTPAEMAKIEQQKKHEKEQLLKQKQSELDSKKKEMEFN